MSVMVSQVTGVSIVYSIVCSKKTSKLRATGRCEGKSPVADEFPAQKASNTKMFPFDDVIMGSRRDRPPPSSGLSWRLPDDDLSIRYSHLHSVCHERSDLRWHLYLVITTGGMSSGPRFNIKMSSYRYRKSHCGDKTVVRSSYLHNGISYTSKMSSLYWIGAQDTSSLTLIVLNLFWET